MNIRLTGLFALRSPLSHIGESISTTSYLVQDPIIQPDGSLAEVFCYSGNAWRGQLRDLAASYMLEKLGRPTVTLDGFHLLFSGGRIGGSQSVDLERARQMRQAIPMLALFGGGVGNQILAGKLRVGNCYPLCAEAAPVLPADLRIEAAKTAYSGITFEKSFSRRDDAKIEGLRQYLPGPKTDLLDAPAGEKDKKAKPKKESGDVADQMRMTCELVAPGTKLYTRIDMLDVSDVEIGAMVSALHQFSISPHIGGQANKGHGLVDLHYQMTNLNSGETCDFLTVNDGPALLAPAAAAAKDAYDQHLRTIYDAALDNNGGIIGKLLEAS